MKHKPLFDILISRNEVAVARGYVAKTSTISILAGLVCLITLIAISPSTIGPIGVTLWFLMLLAALSSFAALVSYLVAKTASKNQASKPAAWRRGFFIGGYITILLALSSLQQLNFRDAILLALLLVLAEFYMVMRK